METIRLPVYRQTAEHHEIGEHGLYYTFVEPDHGRVYSADPLTGQTRDLIASEYDRPELVGYVCAPKGSLLVDDEFEVLLEVPGYHTPIPADEAMGYAQAGLEGLRWEKTDNP